MDFFPSRHLARDTLDDLLISILVAVAAVERWATQPRVGRTLKSSTTARPTRGRLRPPRYFRLLRWSS